MNCLKGEESGRRMRRRDGSFDFFVMFNILLDATFYHWISRACWQPSSLSRWVHPFVDSLSRQRELGPPLRVPPRHRMETEQTVFGFRSFTGGQLAALHLARSAVRGALSVPAALGRQLLASSSPRTVIASDSTTQPNTQLQPQPHAFNTTIKSITASTIPQ
jgi:hypothetical protein